MSGEPIDIEPVIERLGDQYRMLVEGGGGTSATGLVLRAMGLLGRLAAILADPDPGLDDVEVAKESGIALSAIGLYIGTIGSVAEDDLYRGGR
jgi:hypothetical protein